MSEITTQDAIQNYKGLLQQLCHARNLGEPVYESIQQGKSDSPSWVVTVKYGQSSYITRAPIHGSKRLAEQMAAEQVLETIESRQEAFLAGDALDGEPEAVQSSEAAAEVEPLTTESPTMETLHVPIELVASALGIANHRLAASRSGTRYREMTESKNGSQMFAENLADLTMKIVREVVTAAERSNIKFGENIGYN